MSKIDTGGPVFPLENAGTEFQRGMTVRDHFAGLAMQAIFSNGQSLAFAQKFAEADGVPSVLYVSRTSYEIADAMIKARGEVPR